MHPVGIEFGLKHNLIQLRGDGIVLSDQFLGHMSAAARHQLHGKRIDGSELLENVIDRGLGKMNLAIDGPLGPSRAFFAKIDIVVFDTMYFYAERARIGYRTGRTFFFTREFGKELYARKNVLRRAGEVYGYEKVLFLACYDAVVARCKRMIPEDSPQFDLLALCMYQAYDGMMLNRLFERFGTP
jgi:hypothetical protein